VLAGGIDSYFVTSPVHTMNATSSLVARNAAAAAADFVVERDAPRPPRERTLFTVAAVDATAEAPSARSSRTSTRGSTASSSRPTPPRSDETYALFDDAFAATNDPRVPGSSRSIGMLSDFRSLFY
jgi:hypothetical protein